MKQTYIIAEIGNTHEGSIGLAKCFIRAAADCGVNGVKFQTHIFEGESLPDAPNPPYFQEESRSEYFDRTSFNRENYLSLKRYAEVECKVDFISSPFSLEAVDLLEDIGLNIYKIPSGEVTNLPLLEKVARLGKKILLSSGMSSWNDLDLAIKTLQDEGCHDIILMQCTSQYPCPPEQSGLNVLDEMRERYNLQVGYSDHTLGLAVPIAAVVKGACVIEKHFTLSKKMYGSDAKHSMEPQEFNNLVDEIRAVDIALNNKLDKDIKAAELADFKHIFEKSIVSAKALPKGSVLSLDDLSFKKPGGGISAQLTKKLIGKKLTRDIAINHKFSWDDVANE